MSVRVDLLWRRCRLRATHIRTYPTAPYVCISTADCPEENTRDKNEDEEDQESEREMETYMYVYMSVLLSCSYVKSLCICLSASLALCIFLSRARRFPPNRLFFFAVFSASGHGDEEDRYLVSARKSLFFFSFSVMSFGQMGR